MIFRLRLSCLTWLCFTLILSPPPKKNVSTSVDYFKTNLYLTNSYLEFRLINDIISLALGPHMFYQARINNFPDAELRWGGTGRTVDGYQGILPGVTSLSADGWIHYPVPEGSPKVEVSSRLQQFFDGLPISRFNLWSCTTSCTNTLTDRYHTQWGTQTFPCCVIFVIVLVF